MRPLSLLLPQTPGLIELILRRGRPTLRTSPLQRPWPPPPAPAFLHRRLEPASSSDPRRPLRTQKQAPAHPGPKAIPGGAGPHLYPRWAHPGPGCRPGQLWTAVQGQDMPLDRLSKPGACAEAVLRTPLWSSWWVKQVWVGSRTGGGKGRQEVIWAELALDKEKMEGVEVKAGLGGSPVAGGQRAGDAEGAQSPR